MNWQLVVSDSNMLNGFFPDLQTTWILFDRSKKTSMRAKRKPSFLLKNSEQTCFSLTRGWVVALPENTA